MGEEKEVLAIYLLQQAGLRSEIFLPQKGKAFYLSGRGTMMIESRERILNKIKNNIRKKMTLQKQILIF